MMRILNQDSISKKFNWGQVVHNEGFVAFTKHDREPTLRSKECGKRETKDKAKK